MEERPNLVPASYVLLRRGDEVLLLLRKNTGYYDDWYTVPSGHVQAGESPLDAAIRETMEEVGVRLNRDSVKFVHTLYRAKTNATGDRADYFFEATEWEGEPNNIEPEKCERIEWCSFDVLPENLMPYEKDVFTCIKANERYSEGDFNR